MARATRGGGGGDFLAAKDMTVPTFRPTMDEFKDFYGYVMKIEDTIKKYGLVKVVPPKEWVPSKSKYNISADFKIHSPIRQMVNGRAGTYQMMNVVEQEEMSVEEFWRKSQELENQRSKRDVQSALNADYESLQRSFWSNITFMPPLYGADSEGSLFDDDLSGALWNVNKLPSLLSEIQDRTNTPLPGITRSMLYFGQWKSSFAWHVEDMNLYSINYLHFGQCKQWYTIPPAEHERFERLCQSLFPTHYKACPEFLRHKEFVVAPAILKKNNITVYTAIQSERDFMLTYPLAYHAGFNYGFNCAESVNFATPHWLPHGRKAKVCRCAKKYDGAHDTDSAVAINMDFVQSVVNSLKGGRSVSATPAGDAKPKPAAPAHGMLRKIKKEDMPAAAAAAAAGAGAGAAPAAAAASSSAAAPAPKPAAAAVSPAAAAAVAAAPSSSAAAAASPAAAAKPAAAAAAAAATEAAPAAASASSAILPELSPPTPIAVPPIRTQSLGAAEGTVAPSPRTPSQQPVTPSTPSALNRSSSTGDSGTPTAEKEKEKDVALMSPAAAVAAAAKTPFAPSLLQQQQLLLLQQQTYAQLQQLQFIEAARVAQMQQQELQAHMLAVNAAAAAAAAPRPAPIERAKPARDFSKPVMPPRSALFAANPAVDDGPKKMIPRNSKLLKPGPVPTTPTKPPAPAAAAATPSPTAAAAAASDSPAAGDAAAAAAKAPSGPHKYPKKKQKKTASADGTPASAALIPGSPVGGPVPSPKSPAKPAMMQAASLWAKSMGKGAAKPAAAAAAAAAAPAKADVIDLTESPAIGGGAAAAAAPASPPVPAASSSTAAAAASGTASASSSGAAVASAAAAAVAADPGLIEAIRRRRYENGRDEFFVKWRHKSEADNTWEPYECVATVVDDLFPSYRQYLKRKRARAEKAAGRPLTAAEAVDAAHGDDD